MEFFSLVSVASAAGTIEDAVPLGRVLVNTLQLLLSIAGVVGIIGLVVSGIWYLTAGGDEQRMRVAKQGALACVVGLAIILGAVLLVTQIGNLVST